MYWIFEAYNFSFLMSTPVDLKNLIEKTCPLPFLFVKSQIINFIVRYYSGLFPLRLKELYEILDTTALPNNIEI